MNTKTTVKIIAFLLMAVMLLTAASCGTGTTSEDDEGTNSATDSVIDKDREGNPVTLPAAIEKVISMGPSNTEILTALGLGGKIIAADDFSAGIEGLKADIPLFDMYAIDGEQMLNLTPDVIIVTGMSKSTGEDSFKPLTDAGICVIYIPTSSSIEGIKEDILYIAEVMGVKAKGEDIVSDMDKEIDAIKQIGNTITEKKSVYFEIDAAPSMYSFGTGVFMNEMIELIGAKNILADQNWYIAVADEVILNADPDVIFSNVVYVENPVDEIKSRPGWSEITAVKNDDVYFINADDSSRPTHNIVKALKAMAKAVYPDKY